MTEVKVRFLGSGDAFGSGGRFQTCIAVQWQEGHILIDCGASSLIAMKRSGVDPTTIDAVAVSHLHGDHFAGLPFLVLDQQFARRTRALVVAGPPGLRARVLQAMDVLFPGSSTAERTFAVEFVELRARDPTAVGPATVTSYEVRHPSGAPAYALRVAAGGRLVAYTGDTEWTEVLAEVAREADVLISEAYFFDRTVKYHLSYTTLRRHLSELDAQRIVLTHMSADMLAHRTAVSEQMAEDGLALLL